MDAKEIRKLLQTLEDRFDHDCPKGSPEVICSRMTSSWLAEIAAQLAELNATLREEVTPEEIEEITFGGRPNLKITDWRIPDPASATPAQPGHVHDRACAYGKCPEEQP